MVNTKDKLIKIFDEIIDRIGTNKIAYDGLVDEIHFYNSKYKVMFLLKDPNEQNKISDWKFYMETIRREAIEEKASWQNICFWMEALKNEKSTYLNCLDEFYNYNPHKLQKHMLEVSIVNIKKIVGKGINDPVTYNPELQSAINMYGDLVEKEIEIIKPRLIICGGTFEYAKQMFKPKEINVFSTGTQYFVSNSMLFLNFRHPTQYGIDYKILFAYAQKVFVEMREKLEKL